MSTGMERISLPQTWYILSHNYSQEIRPVFPVDVSYVRFMLSVSPIQETVVFALKDTI